jgi:hypothetical protein
MGVGELIGDLAKNVGLTPACVIALVAIYILYKVIVSKDRIIEKQGDSIGQNTKVMIEIKTLLTALISRGQS